MDADGFVVGKRSGLVGLAVFLGSCVVHAFGKQLMTVCSRFASPDASEIKPKESLDGLVLIVSVSVGIV